MMSAPVDLVRAALEQAWQAECASDIYLARQVVDLRGLLAEARTLDYWGARAEKLERERDELRAQLEVIAQEGANQRGPGREVGRQCARSKNWDTLPPEMHLRAAQEAEARAWWALGFAEAIKWECYARFGYDPNDPQPISR